MITTASILYMACLLCDETAGAGAEPPVQTADVWQTSAWFHKVFAHAGGYTLQFDTAADAHYDCSGLGRVHRAGAPTPLCLSLSCTVNGNYKTDLPDAVPLAIAPGVKTADGWQYATGGETVYTVEELHADAAADAARVRLCCRFPGGQTVETQYTADKTGVSIRVKGSGEIALLLPAFAFDGAVHPEITAAEKTLAVSYRGWTCRYTAENAGVADTARMAANRNGHYRVFAAQGRDELAVRITVEKE